MKSKKNKHTKKQIDEYNQKKVRKENKKRRIIFNDVLNITRILRTGI